MVLWTTETPRNASKLQKKAGNLVRKGSGSRRQKLVSEIGSPLSKKSRAGQPSFPDEAGGDAGAVVEKSYSIFTFEALRKFQMEVSGGLMSRLLKLSVLKRSS